MNSSLVVRVEGRHQADIVLDLCDERGIAWLSGDSAKTFYPPGRYYWLWICDDGISYDNGNENTPFGCTESCVLIGAHDPSLPEVLTLITMAWT